MLHVLPVKKLAEHSTLLFVNPYEWSYCSRNRTTIWLAIDMLIARILLIAAAAADAVIIKPHRSTM